MNHTANFSPTLDTTSPPSPLPDINTVTANWTHTLCQRALRTSPTCIVYSGATNIYFVANAPVANIDCAAPRVTVGTATGKTQQSAGTGNLALPHHPLEFPTKGHLMSGF